VSERGGPRLEVRDLAVWRDDRELFHGLSFTLEPGAIAHIEGPNGAGKTTLLRLLCGLLQPAAGEIRWAGRPVTENAGDYARARGYVGHSDALKLDLTASENLRVAAALAGRPADASATQAALDYAGLRGFEDVPVRQLSAGQRRRASLARLQLQGALLWILDEPLTALDASGRAWVEAAIAGHAEAGGMVVLTTHQPMALAQRRTVTRIALEVAA